MVILRSINSSETSTGKRVAIVGLTCDSHNWSSINSSLDELSELVLSIGAIVEIRMVQERKRQDPRLFLGKGKVRLLAKSCAEKDVNMVIVDNELSGVQLRNLESELGRRVIDRTELILEIFASRARTREGKLQVELAQLRYCLPRLVGTGKELSRLGAGIGTRGPGEMRLETDRRKIKLRIGVLSRAIEAVRRRRSNTSARRRKKLVPTIALVGYTNAGKTSVFNMLTTSSSLTSDVLFTTLDPLARRMPFGGHRPVLLSDTVGFISRLPHTLVAAFRATFEQASEADLLLHVIDVSHPERERQIDSVKSVLREMGADHVPLLEVLNKCDLLDVSSYLHLRRINSEAMLVSALTGKGRENLLERISEELLLDVRRVTFNFRNSSEEDKRQITQLYRYGRVIRHVMKNEDVSIEADVPLNLLERFRMRKSINKLEADRSE